MKALTHGIPEFTWRYPCARALYNQGNAGRFCLRFSSLRQIESKYLSYEAS